MAAPPPAAKRARIDEAIAADAIARTNDGADNIVRCLLNTAIDAGLMTHGVPLTITSIIANYMLPDGFIVVGNIVSAMDGFGVWCEGKIDEIFDTTLCVKWTRWPGYQLDLNKDIFTQVRPLDDIDCPVSRWKGSGEPEQKSTLVSPGVRFLPPMPGPSSRNTCGKHFGGEWTQFPGRLMGTGFIHNRLETLLMHDGPVSQSKEWEQRNTAAGPGMFFLLRIPTAFDSNKPKPLNSALSEALHDQYDAQVEEVDGLHFGQILLNRKREKNYYQYLLVSSHTLSGTCPSHGPPLRGHLLLLKVMVQYIHAGRLSTCNVLWAGAHYLPGQTIATAKQWSLCELADWTVQQLFTSSADAASATPIVRLEDLLPEMSFEEQRCAHYDQQKPPNGLSSTVAFSPSVSPNRGFVMPTHEAVVGQRSGWCWLSEPLAPTKSGEDTASKLVFVDRATSATKVASAVGNDNVVCLLLYIPLLPAFYTPPTSTWAIRQHTFNCQSMYNDFDRPDKLYCSKVVFECTEDSGQL